MELYVKNLITKKGELSPKISLPVNSSISVKVIVNFHHFITNPKFDLEKWINVCEMTGGL